MFWWIILALVLAGSIPFALRRAREMRHTRIGRQRREVVRQQRRAEWEEEIRRRSEGR